MNRVILIDGGHSPVAMAQLQLLLKKSGLEAEVLTQQETVTQRLGSPVLPLRIQAECPSPLYFSGEPKFKGTGRSELAQLRKKALHSKPSRKF